MISLWWFWDQLTLLTISCRTHLVPPIFSYGILAFHAPGILFLSFLTVMSFLTTTRLSTMSLGPLLDAPDSCVGWLKPEVVDGETAPCARELLLFPHGVLLLPLVVALLLLAFRTLDPQSFLVKEGVTYCLCCLSYYCRSTTSSTPYYFLNPGLVVGKNHSLGGFSFWGRTAIFSWWEVSSICAGALFPSTTYDPSSPWNSSLMFLHRPEQHSYLNSHVVWRWNQLFQKPVIHFRLTASGCLSPVALISVA